MQVEAEVVHKASLNGSSNGTTYLERSTRLEREMYGGEPYEYYPLGQYIVAAPGV